MATMGSILAMINAIIGILEIYHILSIRMNTEFFIENVFKVIIYIIILFFIIALWFVVAFLGLIEVLFIFLFIFSIFVCYFFIEIVDIEFLLNTTYIKKIYVSISRLTTKEYAVIAYFKEYKVDKQRNKGLLVSIFALPVVVDYILVYMVYIYNSIINNSITKNISLDSSLTFFLGFILSLILFPITIYMINYELKKNFKYIEGTDKESNYYKGFLIDKNYLFWEGDIIRIPKSFEITNEFLAHEAYYIFKPTVEEEVGGFCKILYSEIVFLKANKLKKKISKIIKEWKDFEEYKDEMDEKTKRWATEYSLIKNYFDSLFRKSGQISWELSEKDIDNLIQEIKNFKNN